MSYEADPAGLGVGKRFGPLNMGGVAGVTTGANGEYRLVAEVGGKELPANAAISIEIPEGYAVINRVTVEVESAFAALETVDVDYDGATILSAPVAASAVGVIVGALVASPTVVTSGKAITIDVGALTAGTGYLKVIIEMVRI